MGSATSDVAADEADLFFLHRFLVIGGLGLPLTKGGMEGQSVWEDLVLHGDLDFRLHTKV